MKVGANRFIGVNYIPDNTRMPVPPAYFLQRISDFDSQLVLLPSRTHPAAYVIARRKQFGPGLTAAAIDAYTQPDTKMCVSHSLVPVCLMYRTGPGWDAEAIVRKLAARDIWAHGGADKVADLLETQEETEQQTIRQQIRNDMWDRSGDAWRSYQRRTGQSVTLSPRTERRTIETAPSESMAGSDVVAATTA